MDLKTRKGQSWGFLWLLKCNNCVLLSKLFFFVLFQNLFFRIQLHDGKEIKIVNVMKNSLEVKM